MLTVYSVSVALVWGWTIMQLIRRNTKRLVKGLVIGIGSSLFSIQIFFMADWIALALFFLGATFSSLIHFLWLRRIQIRFMLNEKLGGI